MSASEPALCPVQPERRDRHPPPNFDRVAWFYRWAEYWALGPLLTRTREHFLPELASARRAVALGDGDGRFTAALLRAAPTLELHAVDSSAAMLRRLRTLCLSGGCGDRVITSQGSVLETVVDPDCDLIATHFLLDCLSQAEVVTLAGRMASQVRPGCRWVISEFGPPRSPRLRWVAAAYIRLLYLAFRVLTDLRTQQLPDPQSALRSAGFVRLRRKERLGGFLYSELWELRPGDTATL